MQNDFLASAKKAEGPQAEAFIQDILRERPELTGETFYSPGGGKMAITILTQNEVFKGLKSRHDQSNMVKEYTVQKTLADAGLAVAPVTHIGKETTFYSMKRLNGVMLTPEIVKTLNAEEQKQLAEDLAECMAGINKVLSSADKNLGPASPWAPDTTKIAQALLDPSMKEYIGDIYPLLCEKMVPYVLQMAEKQPVFLHSDMHQENMIVNPKTKRLSGIIDFGFVDHAVPELALRKLEGFPHAFIDQLSKAYGERIGQKVSYEETLLCQIAKPLVGIHLSLQRGYNPYQYIKPLKEAVDELKAYLDHKSSPAIAQSAEVKQKPAQPSKSPSAS